MHQVTFHFILLIMEETVIDLQTNLWMKQLKILFWISKVLPHLNQASRNIFCAQIIELSNSFLRCLDERVAMRYCLFQNKETHRHTMKLHHILCSSLTVSDIKNSMPILLGFVTKSWLHIWFVTWNSTSILYSQYLLLHCFKSYCCSIFFSKLLFSSIFVCTNIRTDKLYYTANPFSLEWQTLDIVPWKIMKHQI